MLNKFFNKPLLILAVLVVLVIASVPFQKKIDNQRSKFRSIEHSLHLKPSTLKKISIGFDEILSDLYLFRVLQYFGDPDTKMENKNPQLVYNYFDTITELDPMFINAYRFGGTFLGEPHPIGFGDIENAMKLLDKGRENNPDNFRLPLEQAFLYYLHTNNYAKAAELFEIASEKPGVGATRSASIKGLAANARKRSGDRELSKEIWQYIYETTENEGRKNFALQNLNELNTQDFEDKLTELTLKYENDRATYPSSLKQLKDMGYLKKIPRDHEGEDFLVLKNIKKVRSKTLAKKILDENARFYTAKAKRYNQEYGEYPGNMEELKNYFINTSQFIDYTDHPLGEEYIYDPETGQVDYDKWFLE